MEGSSVFLIDQNLLPFDFKIIELKTHIDTCRAIKTMIVRGAGAIGAAAGFAMAQAVLEAEEKNFKSCIEKAREAGKVRIEDPIILRIDGKKAKKDDLKIYHAGTDVYLTSSVDSKYISKVKEKN